MCTNAEALQAGAMTRRSPGSSMLQVGHKVNRDASKVLMRADLRALACHGCLWLSGCDEKVSRTECDTSGGIWHGEDSEFAEFTETSALGFDKDGTVSAAELRKSSAHTDERPAEQSWGQANALAREDAVHFSSQQVNTSAVQAGPESWEQWYTPQAIAIRVVVDLVLLALCCTFGPSCWGSQG